LILASAGCLLFRAPCLHLAHSRLTASDLTYHHWSQAERHPFQETLKHQSILGEETLAARFHACDRRANLNEISKGQRRLLVDTLADYRARYPRDEALARAYLPGAYSLKAIGDFFGVYYMAVSRAVRRSEQSKMLECETL
jgi:hypothetical protein